MRYGFKIWSAFANFQFRKFWRDLRCGFRRVELPYMQPIKVPVFKIAKNSTVRISEIKSRRFYIIDRAQIRAKINCFKGKNGRPSIFHTLPYERYQIEENKKFDKEIYEKINTALA